MNNCMIERINKNEERLDKAKETIKKIKAGVLSEDEVWNLLEEYNCLLKELKKILNKENI